MQLISTIFPVVTIALAGYFLRHKKYLSNADGIALENISFNFLIPCLLFTGTATTDFPAAIEWGLLGGFYSAILVVYLFGMLVGKIFFSYNTVELSVFGMGGAYSNATIIGIPICLQVFGDESFLPIFIIISTHNILLFSFGTIFAEARNESSRSILHDLLVIIRDLVMHPITGSLLAGLAINLLNIPIYPPLLSTLDLIRQAAVPMALFALGGALTSYKITGKIRETMTLVLTKLLVLPSLVWFFLFFVFEVNPLWGETAVLLAAMPVGIAPYVFSLRYQACQSEIASSIVISAMLSVFTIGIFILLVT